MKDKIKIYISSSWKNRDRVRKIAEQLREAGFDPYDFTDPRCRNSPELPPERFPEKFDPEKHVYRQYLLQHPEWRAAVEGNRLAIEFSDVILLLLPCGADAHSDWAYGVALRKLSAVVGHPPAGERTPCHLWANKMLDTDEEILPWLKIQRDAMEGRGELHHPQLVKRL